MRDDQRHDPHKHDDDQEDLFDDALDDLFGPDEEDDQGIQPQRTGQSPQPSGGSAPPPRRYEPDTEHHRMDDDHVLGPENTQPPDSFTIEEPAPEAATQHPAALASERVAGPAERRPATRDWRKIACFGCLAAVGIPALCLAALIVLGLIVGEDSSEPTTVGVFVDEVTPPETDPGVLAQRPTQTGNSESDTVADPEPYRSIMDGRAPFTVVIDGDPGYGDLEKPVPVGAPAPLGGGWQLKVNSVTPNANEIIAEANMFNDPPANDRQFVIASVMVTNFSERAGSFDASFRLRLVGGVTGTVYTTFDETDRCGVIPKAAEESTIKPDGSMTGNVCWQVLKQDVDSLLLYNESFDVEDRAIWFTLTSSGVSASSGP